MRNRVILCVSLLAVAAVGLGCNPKYCAGHVGNDCDNPLIDGGGGGGDAPIDAFKCTNDTQCTSAATPACDLDDGACVACTATDIGACADTTPVCGSDDACHACTSHAQCTSDVCLPTGACDSGSDVAYVQGSGGSGGAGSGSDCTQADPCATITVALATARPIIKVAGAVNDQVTINNQNVTIYADPGAKLSSTSNGILLTISGTSEVPIYDLEIEGASGVGNPGISLPTGNTATLSLMRVTTDSNNGGGIVAAAGTVNIDGSTISSNGTTGITATGGALTIEQSTITGNTSGGLSITGAAFTIVNNFITRNGSSTGSLLGGATITATAAGARQFDFNTVADNVAETGFTNGLICEADAAFTLDSNIIYSSLGSAGALQFQSLGNCATKYSDIGGSAATAGSGNIDADPKFVSTTMPFNYHIQSNSPCIGAGDPATAVGSDFDGQTRPAGSADIGADQYYP